MRIVSFQIMQGYAAVTGSGFSGTHRISLDPSIVALCEDGSLWERPLCDSEKWKGWTSIELPPTTQHVAQAKCNCYDTQVICPHGNTFIFPEKDYPALSGEVAAYRKLHPRVGMWDAKKAVESMSRAERSALKAEGTAGDAADRSESGLASGRRDALSETPNAPSAPTRNDKYPLASKDPAMQRICDFCLDTFGNHSSGQNWCPAGQGFSDTYRFREQTPRRQEQR